MEDIKTAYKNCKGDMDQIMDKVLCADYTDEPRIRTIIQQAIDLGELPFYKAFAKESKQKMNSRKRRVCLTNVNTLCEQMCTICH